MARFHQREGSVIDVRRLLGETEGRTLERKRDLSSLSPVLKTLVAFANTAGGTLLAGIEDDGTVVGLDDVRNQEERLANTIADSVEPALLPDIEAVTVDGRDLLMVRVARWPGPFFLKSKGPEKGVYVRLGSTNRRADEQTLAELRLLTRRLAFDQEPCAGATLRDLDLDAAREAFANAVAHTDYTQRGMQIMVAIFSNRLEIQNPGTLPFPMTLDDLKRGVSRIRNPVITRVLRELEFMEEWGTGYRRISEDCAQGGYPLPHWEELGAVVRIVFRPHPEAQAQGDRDADVANHGADVGNRDARVGSHVVNSGQDVGDGVADAPNGVADVGNHGADVGNRGATVGRRVGVAGGTKALASAERQAWFLDQIRDLQSVGAKELASHFGVTRRTAERDVADLTRRGLVRFVGRTRGGRYRLPGQEGVPDAGKDVNERQRWFLAQLDKTEASAGVKELASHFGVSERTAQRDLADLFRRGRIRVIGNRKAGRYGLREA